jgi:hypothetical protein
MVQTPPPKDPGFCSMPYFVKWRMTPAGKLIENRVGYGPPSEALDFACATLHQNPFEIWVEDEHGNSIADKQRIIEHCRERALMPR